ncbi:M61 family metallopeptidase [Pedobacter insulae]|uniref:Predicted metalloprotease, contains C-terminal PDZ domain n=1 Tax=Pedobacter insulae TaxID=414048 RepID=A0A1I2X6S3_9SPHI|nr:PDZ domain-containing protein [Pedobacter insulae]SFH08727.1 Predicted metalloprotease, contains C-terminal PDZ domain [Pedobacter insulae]
MKRSLLAVGLFLASFSVNAQQEISYELSFPNAIHHEAEITMSVPNVPTGTLKVRMSRSSPGRYATHEFGKNVYRFKAFDEQGKKLTVLQLAGDEYSIPNHGNTVKITYTLFGNWIDGTYAGFDETHAHMNIPATFAYPIGMDKRPRTVKFNLTNKQNWKVATQLKPLTNGVYYAPNFQYFMDSPIELASYHTASWNVKNPDGKTQTIHLVSHSKDDQKTIDNYAEMLKKMVDEHFAVWGEFPAYDYGNYYFLHDVYPDYAGDGMEHRNSTVIVQRTPKIAGYESNLLGTFSHEYFHSWNVERLRPKTLEPFNFEHSNMSDELWLAEGFTQYYGNLLLTRAGFKSVENASQTFNGIINTVLNSSGAKNFSPIEASRYAVFADAGVSIDQTNKNNIFTSYYTYGASVALALDLRLRAEFKLTLDDYMRALWKAYGKPEIPYTVPDLEKTLGLLTKNTAFANDFFKKYVYGTEKNDYAKLLLHAGFILRKADPNGAYTGMGRVTFENGKATLGSTMAGTPAYEAGLDFGSMLLTMDGIAIKDQASLNSVTKDHKPGDTINVTYSYYGEEKTTKLTFSENPVLEIIPIEKTGGSLTPAMQTFRDSWLNSQVKK